MLSKAQTLEHTLLLIIFTKSWNYNYFRNKNIYVLAFRNIRNGIQFGVYKVLQEVHHVRQLEGVQKVTIYMDYICFKE